MPRTQVLQHRRSWKEIVPGGAAGLQTRLVAPCVAGWVRLPLLSATLALLPCRSIAHSGAQAQWRSGHSLHRALLATTRQQSRASNQPARSCPCTAEPFPASRQNASLAVDHCSAAISIEKSMNRGSTLRRGGKQNVPKFHQARRLSMPHGRSPCSKRLTCWRALRQGPLVHWLEQLAHRLSCWRDGCRWRSRQRRR